MDAFLLAAGLGTRLRPLTDEIPKPLVLLAGESLISRNLKLLKKIDCSRVVVNTHYLAHKLDEYIGDGSAWGMEILTRHETSLLDTGGGLKNCINLLRGEFFITWNSDVYIDPSFVEDESRGVSEFESLKALSINEEKNPTISLVVRRDTEDNIKHYGGLGINSEGRVIEFLGQKYGTCEITERVMFAGITICKGTVQEFFPLNQSVFSLTRDLFPRILAGSADSASGGIWTSFCTSYWNDVGTIDRLNTASKEVEKCSPVVKS